MIYRLTSGTYVEPFLPLGQREMVVGVMVLISGGDVLSV